MSNSHNAPESGALTLEEVTIFENARQAVVTLKKTFETWTVIGMAVDAARKRADRVGGRQTFMRLIEQQGLRPIVDKSTASRLLRIMDALPEVMAWRQTLTARQQVDWAAPTAVMKHCPLFRPVIDNGKEKRPSAQAQMKENIAALEDKNFRLERELKQRGDGDRWKPTDTAKDIARVMVETLKPSKATEVARQILSLLKKVKTGRVSKEVLGAGA
jgi:hypothetical protein